MKSVAQVVAAVAVGAVAVGAAVSASQRAAGASPSTDARVERGRYLVSSIGCGDCHTPKKMGKDGPELDQSRLFAGHPEDSNLPPGPPAQGPWIASASWDLTAWHGPWGTTYAMNLTPDENTGIGSWSEETFVTALKTGRHMGVSRPILPPMPWQFFRNLTEEDLGAIYAYLRSLPPVHNRIPEPLPPAAQTASR
ncbi:MAG TPA: c-type cytochrome [Vicinamibacteria bacterium]